MVHVPGTHTGIATARRFLQHLKESILHFYGDEPQKSPTRRSTTGTIQPLILDLPFGGVGNSGMSKYHGEWGFRAYTNARGVLYHGTGIDPELRYPLYSRQKKRGEYRSLCKRVNTLYEAQRGVGKSSHHPATKGATSHRSPVPRCFL